VVGVGLTDERVELEDGTSALLYDWHGQRVAVRDDARDAIECVSLWLDDDMPAEEKAGRIIRTMFADPGAAWLACDYSEAEFGRLVEAVTWDVFGVDADGTHRSDEPLWDLEEDAAIIRTSLRQAYGIDWDRDRSRIPWAEFCVMVAALPYETPLGFAMHYRNPANRPKRTKYNAEEVARFDRLHSELRLRGRGRGRDDVEAQAHAMDDMAAALAGTVRRDG
jgi:hypothetical protein